MNVLTEVPMPRARLQQVTPRDFQALLERVEKLEQASGKKRGRPAKEEENGDSDE